MSVEHTMATGNAGTLKIIDETDQSLNGIYPRNIQLWIRSISVVSVPQLSWSIEFDGVTPNLRAFNFQNTTLWQRLGVVYAGYAETATLYLGNTGTTQLGGPTTFTVDLLGGVSKADVNVGGVHKSAIPYVRDGGVWKLADAYVMDQGSWKKSI